LGLPINENESRTVQDDATAVLGVGSGRYGETKAIFNQTSDFFFVSGQEQPAPGIGFKSAGVL
jgi:hypothetical protein